jgi:hypothetical protein
MKSKQKFKECQNFLKINILRSGHQSNDEKTSLFFSAKTIGKKYSIHTFFNI